MPKCLQIISTEQKLEDVTSAIVKELTPSCAECGISSDIIDEQSFACFPESPTHVTLRARLRGSAETDSGSLISLLESWVSGGATIIVTGVLMTVDPECSVAISSLSEKEGSITTTHPPDNTASSTSPTTSSHWPQLCRQHSSHYWRSGSGCGAHHSCGCIDIWSSSSETQESPRGTFHQEHCRVG